MHANVHTQTRNKILRFWKFYQNMASTYFAVTEPRSQYIWVCIKYFGGCLSNVRWGVTATFTFLSLGHKRMVFTPVFAASMVDGCGRAGAGLPLAAARWLCVYWALYPAVLCWAGAGAGAGCIWKLNMIKSCQATQPSTQQPGQVAPPRCSTFLALGRDGLTFTNNVYMFNVYNVSHKNIF